jgi:hypothetical protein
MMIMPLHQQLLQMVIVRFQDLDLKLVMCFLLKSLRFLDLDGKEVENVKLGGRRITKHAKLWVKNAFDEWKQFRGFDMTKLIANLSKDEGLVKNLVDMLSIFVLHVVEKDNSLCPPTKYTSKPTFVF